MKTIKELGIKYNTDKVTYHEYADSYDFLFKNISSNNFKLLELGIYNGGSILMWDEYFKQSCLNYKIYGIDIENKSNLNIENENISFFYGDQSDVNFLKNVTSSTGELDVIIDDACHISKPIITSFEALFLSLKPGGLYIIEDLSASYNPKLGGDPLNFNNINTTVGYFKNIIDSLNDRYDECKLYNYNPHHFINNIEHITFFRRMLAIRKK